MRAAVLLAALLPAAPAAAADATLRATLRDQYAPTAVTIERGGTLTFANDDIDRHDVSADTADGDRPLFASPVLAPGGRAAVDRVAALAPGRYGFHCSLHAFMTGTLTVEGLAVAVLSRRIADARRGLRIRVRSVPGGDVAISATLRAGRRRAALPAVSWTVAGSRTARLALGARAKRLLAGARRALVAVRAGDGAHDGVAQAVLR